MPVTQATRFDIPALLSLVNGAYRGEGPANRNPFTMGKNSDGKNNRWNW